MQNIRRYCRFELSNQNIEHVREQFTLLSKMYFGHNVIQNVSKTLIDIIIIVLTFHIVRNIPTQIKKNLIFIIFQYEKVHFKKTSHKRFCAKLI